MRIVTLVALTGPTESIGISVMLPRQFLNLMHFTAAVVESVKKLITLHPSKHEGRTARSKLVCSLQRGHTKPVSVTGILSGAVCFSPDSHTFIFCCNSSNDLKKAKDTDKQQPGGTPLYLAIQRLNSWKLIVLPGILLMASSQRSYCIFVCLYIFDFNSESLEERNSILWTYSQFQQARIQAPRQDGALQAELTSFWESTGVQEENVSCEEKKTTTKQETHSMDGGEIRGKWIRSLKKGVMRIKEELCTKPK